MEHLEIFHDMGLHHHLGTVVQFWDWTHDEPSDRGQCVYTDTSEGRSGWHSEHCSRQLEFVICSISMFIFIYQLFLLKYTYTT